MSGRSPGRYKLIAIDMDGTLLSNRGEVTPRTKAAIHRCLSAGILICFATGHATVPPAPPCSASTTMTSSGSSAGAQPANHACAAFGL